MAAATSQPNGPADLDIAAVENIPRDTLVALLKRKDREAKATASKLEKLEERYVKVVRFNKLLMEDRTSFQRFCSELLPESDGIFEEGAAQESPVNLDALLRRLSAWRNTFEAVSEDRNIFQQFVELVFPGDESVKQLFQGPALSSEAFDLLQQRWVALEDLHNQSIASINAMAREQFASRHVELEEALSAKHEAEKRVQEMQEQLTVFAREKAQSLKQKLQGGAEQANEEPNDSGAVGPGASGANQGQATPDPRLLARSEAAIRHEKELREAAEAREEDLRRSLEEQEAAVKRLKKEVAEAREEGLRQNQQARQQMEQKDVAVQQLHKRMAELEQELGSNDFIVRLAEQQAGRDAEIKLHNKEVHQLHQSLTDNERMLQMNRTQERMLKDRIRELESSQNRLHTAGDYLKHVVLKYIQYNQKGDLKAQTLVPVLTELLHLQPEERRTVEQGPALPQSLLLINQAVGGATTWLRGNETGAPPATEELEGSG